MANTPAKEAESDSATLPESEDLLTVSAAATLLGLSERTLYRLLKSDNLAARTLAKHRQTVTGRRLTTLLPLPLVEELRQVYVPPERLERAKQAPPNNADNDGSETATNTGETVTDTGADADKTPADGDTAGMLPALLYRQRIADLEAMNAELRADKERLYQLLEAAQTNLRNEQTLRALPDPVNGRSTGNAPKQANSVQGEAETSANGNHGVSEASPREAPTEAKNENAGFWAWLWQRIRD